MAYRDCLKAALLAAGFAAAFLTSGGQALAAPAAPSRDPQAIQLPKFIFPGNRRPADRAWDDVLQDRTETNIYDYLVYCAGGGVSECNQNVQLAVDYLIQRYAHARTNYRTQHRILASTAGVTGAGLAVASVALPPVGLTALAATAVAPIMYDDMAGVNNRTALFAAGAVSLQSLSLRYQSLKAAAHRALDAYSELATVYSDPTNPSVNFREHCIGLDKPDYTSLPADFTATKQLVSEIQALDAKCNAVIARKAQADLIQKELQLALTTQDGAEDVIDQAYAADTLRLLDEMEAIQRGFDVAPGAALATAVAAPIQAVATLLKGGANSLTNASQITVVNEVLPMSPIAVTTIETTPFSTTIALSDVDISSFKDLTGWTAPEVKAAANTAAAKATAAKATAAKTAAAQATSKTLRDRADKVVKDLDDVGPRFNVFVTRFQDWQALNSGATVALVMGPPSFGANAGAKAGGSGTTNSGQGTSVKSGGSGSTGTTPS